jgi:hypothetical protein
MNIRIAPLLWTLFIIPVFCIYYPVGMIWVNKIDNSRDIDTAPYHVDGGSEAVTTAIALVNRETSRHWTPNDPFFYPGAALVRMPSFQRGIISSVARFSIELSDQLGRSRGSSEADKDLLKAAGLLNYSPNVWMWDFSVSWFPTASSEKQYQQGMKALISYNQRVAKGEATFERRSDNLMQVLDRIALDLGSASAAIDEHIKGHSAFALRSSAELFYNTKGRMYGNYMLLKSLEKDFAPVIAEKQIGTVWKAMLDSLEEGMESNHFLVINADPKDSIFANHLASEGFYLMRARTQMRELTNILLK